MAISPGVGSSSNSKTPVTLSEINVTPLVDVMLVLLIIFMVSAPLLQQGISVDLPKAKSTALSEQPDQLVLIITRRKEIRLNDQTVELQQLLSKLMGYVAKKDNVEILIQADRSVPYGFVAQVMGEVKAAKISRVGLVTAPPTAEAGTDTSGSETKR